MIGSIRLPLTGVMCALALLVGGCATRGTARFPGSPVPQTATAPAPDRPDQPIVPSDPVTEPVPLSARGSETGQPDESTTTDTDSVLEIQAPAPEATEAVAVDLWPVVPGIDIPLNDKVLRAVDLLTGRRKPFLEEGLGRSLQYLPMIQDILRAEGLPLDLAFVPLVESAFKPKALSRAQARGIWQFMGGTGLENGLAHDWYIDERVDAEKATLAAAKYLKALSVMFDGDWALALASYNAGQGRVKNALKRSGHTDYWKLTDSTTFLPRETRDYVPLVMAAMLIGRDPARHGILVQPIDALRYETVTLPTAVDLRRIAEWIGTPLKSIQDLNPELRRWLTPVRATSYQLKVPAGTGDFVRAHLAQVDLDGLAPLDWHTVKKGETLVAIARALDVNRIDLAGANYLSTRARLQVGQRLIIPRPPAMRLASHDDSPVPESRPDPASRGATVVTASNTTPADERPLPASLVHRVKRGDTLFALAKMYRTSIASLKDWNHLRSNTIRVGQRLTVFTERATTATN